MADRRWKDYNWYVATADGKKYEVISQAQMLAVMMDIRDELKRLNNVLQCPNFIAVPSKLDAIKTELRQVRLNTRKKKAMQKPKLRAVA